MLALLHTEEERKSHGNNCAHNPSIPRYYQPRDYHKYRPDVIYLAQENLKNFYLNPKAWLQSLIDSRKSTRQERSEGRERDIALLQLLLQYTELSSLRVGIPKENGEFISFDMKFMARELHWRTSADEKEDEVRVKQGMPPKNRGVKRVWRGLKALSGAGYISIHPRYEKFEVDAEARYVGLAAVRRVHPKTFYELGVSPAKLETKRKEAGKQLKEKALAYLNKVASEVERGVMGAVEKLLNFGKPWKRYKASEGSWARERRIEQEKQRQVRAFTLKQQPENVMLSAVEFYVKYPELEPHPRK